MPLASIAATSASIMPPSAASCPSVSRTWGKFSHAVDLGGAAAQARSGSCTFTDQADHRLVVLVDVRGRGVKLLLAHLQVAVKTKIRSHGTLTSSK